jgi:ribosomal protein L21
MQRIDSVTMETLNAATAAQGIIATTTTGNKATTTAEVTAEVIEAKRKQVIKLFGNSKRLRIHRYGYARHHGWW